MKIKFPIRKRFLIGVLLLLAALLTVGILLAVKMNAILDQYVCDMITEQASTMADLENEFFDSEFRQLTGLAGLLELQAEDETAVREAAEKLFALQAEKGMEKGILTLDGRAVIGRELKLSDFPCIKTAFHGHNTIGFQPEIGLLFCMPVYRSGNVRYVVYYLYSPEETQRRFASGAYQGKASVIVANKADQVVVRSTDRQVDEKLIGHLEESGLGKEMRDRLNIATAAAVMGKWQNKNSVFFIAEIGDTDLYLLGKLYTEDAAGDVEALMVLLIWVFGLLVVLMVSGMIFLVSIEEKAMESIALKEAKEAAEKANAAKSDFLSSMSHEIRTPINAVLGMTEMILRESKEEQILDYASSIESSGNALLSLINDVLDFSKIESGKMEITESEYDLYALVNDCYHMVIGRADAKNLQLNVSCQEDLPKRLYGDMVHIRQIIVNFLTNAIKYTKKGKVDFVITGEKQQDGKVSLLFEVKDTGIGITEENIQKLFEKFERFDMKKNQSVEGTGLGLAITKQLAELLGGVISVDSVYGEGSTFRIRLEQTVTDQAPIGKIGFGYDVKSVKEKQQKKRFEAPGKKLLVVDDVDMNLKVFGFLLKNSKMEIDTALSGKICLEMITQKKYDIIFMDHMMPEMDGIETFRNMKELEGNLSKDAPVIMLTANATAGVKEEYLQEGFKDYLAKPVRGDQLEELLAKYL